MIDRSFESILSQSIGFENLEVIFVDDCSTDNSKSKIMKLSEEYDNVKGIFLEENSGFAGKPRNVGLQHASADYVMFLDSDDYFLENACELLYDRITGDDLDLVSGNFSIEYEENVIRWSHVGIDDELKVNSIYDKPSLLIIAPSIWSKIYRKDMIIDNDILFDEGLPGQDALFMYEVLLNAKGILFVNVPLVIYCKRDYSQTKEKSVTDDTTFKKLYYYLIVYEKMYQVLHDYDESFEVAVSSHFSYWSGLLRNSLLSSNEKVVLMNDFQKIFRKVNAHLSDENDLITLLMPVQSRTIMNILFVENEELEKISMNEFGNSYQYQLKVMELNNKLFIEKRKNSVKSPQLEDSYDDEKEGYFDRIKSFGRSIF